MLPFLQANWLPVLGFIVLCACVGSLVAYEWGRYHPSMAVSSAPGIVVPKKTNVVIPAGGAVKVTAPDGSAVVRQAPPKTSSTVTVDKGSHIEVITAKAPSIPPAPTPPPLAPVRAVSLPVAAVAAVTPPATAQAVLTDAAKAAHQEVGSHMAAVSTALDAASKSMQRMSEAHAKSAEKVVQPTPGA